MKPSRRTAAVGLASLLILTWAGSAVAAEITVSGSCTLRDAIRAANSDAARGGCPAGNGADTIVLAAGTVHVLGSFPPTLTTPITIESSIPGAVAAIDGDIKRRALRIDGATVTLRDAVVRSGFLQGVADLGGAGVLVTNGTLNLIDSGVTGNTVVRGQTEGGGIKLVNSHLNALRSVIAGNKIILEDTPFANAQHGGQIAMFDSTAAFDQVSIYGVLAIPGLTLGKEVAFRGGGLYLDNSEVTMQNSTIRGLRIGDGTLGIVGAPSYTAGFGADMYLTNGSSAELTNVTVADPDILGEQSRIYAVDSDLVFNHVSLLAAHNGITLENASTMQATNSLFMTDGANPDFCRRIIAGQWAPFTFDVNSGNLFPATASCPAGPSIGEGDWGLLGDHGGPTHTIPLTPSQWNPALDAGDPAFCRATDQRFRPRDATCDSGAFELLEEADLAVDLRLETEPPYYRGQTIRYLLTVSNGGPAPAYRVDAGVLL